MSRATESRAAHCIWGSKRRLAVPIVLRIGSGQFRLIVPGIIADSNRWNQSIFYPGPSHALGPSKMTKAAKLMIKWTRIRGIVFLGFSFLFATGCASFPPPTETMAEAIASVRGAEEVGAEEIPVAALQLQLAREEITKARALMAEGENEPAYYQALRAAHDAELAIALVRETEARQVAKRAEQDLDANQSNEVKVNP